MPEDQWWAEPTGESPDQLLTLGDRALRDLEVVLGAAAGDPALLSPVRVPQPVPLEVWASALPVP